MYYKHINQVHIEVTDRCNAECPACPRSHGGGQVMPYVKNQELGLEYFHILGRDFISQISKWNFCGTKGDPASAQELFEILDFILDCNPDAEIDIRTNGGARNEKFWSRVGYRFKGTRGRARVVWSIDGWGDNNEVYRKNVKWDKLYANLLAYIKTGAQSKWEFSNFAHNQQDVHLIRNFCNKYKIELFEREPFGFESVNTESNVVYKTMPVYQKVKDVSNKLDSNLAYTIKPYGVKEEDLVNEHNEKYSLSKWKPGFYDLDQWQHLKNSDVNIDCMVNNEDRHEVFMDSNGMILPCCFTASKYVMGDEQLVGMYSPYEKELTVTKDNSIYDVLNHKVFTKIMPDGMSGKLDDKAGYCVTCVQHCKNRNAIIDNPDVHTGVGSTTPD